jgi:hypothetical protein
MKRLKIATLGTPADYRSSLIPIIIRELGYEILWAGLSQSDLVIYGPFYMRLKPYRYLPKPLRPFALEIEKSLLNRQFQPISLFQTGENIRHDMMMTDYSISFDLTTEPNHYRFPYWMEMVDWSHEGVVGNTNPRFGRLLSLNQMMLPLGSQFLGRNRKAAFITSHLVEPRKTLYNAISKMLEVEGFGPYFNPLIKDHHHRGFVKSELLQNFSFNLCPENGLYPGYYTEKIPEAFLSGCLPITWVDSNVNVDFNPLAMINLQALMWSNFEGLKEMIQDEVQLKQFAQQSLLLQKPSIEPLKGFIQRIIRDALS